MNYNNIPKYHNFSKVDYKRELLKYKKAIVALNSDIRWKKKLYEKRMKVEIGNVSASICTSSLRPPRTENLCNYEELDFELCERKLIDVAIEKDMDIERKIVQLEEEPMITFQEEHGITEEMCLYEQDKFLYHGIRLGNQLEILEKILRDKKILAGKYIDGYYHYDDNCNDGEYISLINYSDSLEFETFIRNNICFVINPLIEAYKTKYLQCDEWDYMKKNNLPVKNRYSYARYEYQVKDQIPLEQVRAIGISGRYLLYIKLTQGYEKADRYKQQIIDLLEKYSIELPIVDIDCYNTEVYFPKRKKLNY